MTDISTEIKKVLSDLNLESINLGACTGDWIKPAAGRELTSETPIDGTPIAKVLQADEEAYDRVIATAQEAFLEWRMTPAPVRGQLVRDLGNELRKYKEPLGKLVLRASVRSRR
jgi:aldehyde dehydrogenase (NAD+)